MSKDPRSSAFQRINAMELGVDAPTPTSMPPEFQLMYPRRVRRSGWHIQPDGQSFHFVGYAILTPADEVTYRLSDPENGLHPDDLKAFRVSLSGPVKHGPMARLFASLKFWR
jgi:hypothetical protein